MIKPEDLRIGDLVRVCSNNCMIPKGAICEVVAIDSEQTCEDKKGIVGLLQTLEKNGGFLMVLGVIISKAFLSRPNSSKRMGLRTSTLWHIWI